MSSILFLALQCFECSTMQVKQKKKSSNNWVCVVCNQKQSVRKVFAQGYKAKDLRFFVQSFNMSRKVADEEKQAVADTFPEVEEDEKASDVRGKKRSDWSEYLDSDPPNERLRLIGEEEDLKIVTEMPKDMFKRPKLNNYSKAGGGSLSGKRDDGGLSKPSFSRRSIKCPDLRSDDVMTRKKDTEQRNFKPERVAKPASKWDAYLIDDEGGYQGAPRCGGGRGALKDDGVGEWDRGVTDASSEYQVVDDEVHPDFM
ncbi:hypothetical protein IGI04_028674 [Brassica rapa subsp. trilocularis]|uniref:MRN complex-interacting protein N-terminal domain-containing protein n=1 Tax=Brassica rapa subsp. trilocularis TaxID=1813537 RepID=A0ABQ7L3J8_BRACM|nr:hypothetical protein IGI04_028674 [Brassica rapa subsp. trilocularis]